jgi:hypothetical protein
VTRAQIKRYPVERIRLDRGGYDRTGRYWGLGAPLYRVWDNEEERFYCQEVRAPNARAARQSVL